MPLFLPKISTLRSSHQFVHRQGKANGQPSDTWKFVTCSHDHCIAISDTEAHSRSKTSHNGVFNM